LTITVINLTVGFISAGVCAQTGKTPDLRPTIQAVTV
jgi:hypothetical protein